MAFAPDVNPSAIVGRSHLGQGEVSVSGHERNHLFLSDRGVAFRDISGLSGLDHVGDSRVFALLDYDRDGWQDVALVNANAPLFSLFRNRLGDRTARPAAMIAVRFVGGNRTARPTDTWSARDGYGVIVTVDGLAGGVVRREHRAGEGFAAQNSATLPIGLGAATEAPALAVRWPSGRIQRATAVPAGSLVTVYENPADSPTGAPFVVEPYTPVVAATPPRPEGDRLNLAADRAGGALRLYTTMATWCPSCRRELPHLARLRAVFSARELSLLAVPVDPTDTLAMLRAYVDEHQPAYRLLDDLSEAETARVQALAAGVAPADALPVSIVTDADGRVLSAMAGVPSVSALRQRLAEVGVGRDAAASASTASHTAGITP